MDVIKTDYLIIGAGIIGLSVAMNLRKYFPKDKICIIDKEPNLGLHSSGRNSGVLHAGFYYHPDSLKAKFTKNGNFELKTYCENKGLKINKCGKVVVAKNEAELETLYELKRRGDINGVETYLIDEKELKDIEPLAKTFKYALWSPNTAVVDPLQVLEAFKEDLINQETNFYFNTPYKKRVGKNAILAGNYIFEYKKLINCAGLYADKVAKDFKLGYNYFLIPFKGIYLELVDKKPFIKTNIYPVPNIKTPFLGVHFTIKIDNSIKLGPTAMPCFWRENYEGLHNFTFEEFLGITLRLLQIIFKSSYLREVALSEFKNWFKINIVKKASELVKQMPLNASWKWGKAGIRAQLINVETLEFVNDFVVESDSESIHILNSVSPGFTASLPFTRYVVEKYLI